MIQRWKQFSRWKKWIFAIFSTLLIIILLGTSILIYQIKQIDLNEIQKRVNERQEPTDNLKETKELGNIVGSTIDKANTMVTKPIETQDALDVAAILLKSGLSMREIYYLTGKSTDNLSIDEKQKIRDLLLAKLSHEEIEALRSITKDYGKNLVILDSSYPIELVGVYDQEERQKIKGELSPINNPLTPEPTPTPIIAVIGNTPTQESQSQQANSELNIQVQEKLKEIQEGCSAKVNFLLNEIIQSVTTDVSIESIQNTYLPKVSEAENQCDGQFNQLIASVSQKLPSTDITLWRAQYENAKAAARNAAISKLINALPKKS